MVLVIKWIVSAFTATLLLGCIKADECGRTMGCFRVPIGCSATNCTYSLTWQKDGSDHIHFEYAAHFETTNPLPWAGFGIATAPKMYGATVVDCIVKDSSQVVIQMSYNSENKHENNPLNNKHLGLVESSLTGSKVDSHIFCNFTRLRVIRKPDPESSKVKDLTSPYYILFATGPTDGNGLKHRHDFNSFDPLATDIAVDFNKYTDNGKDYSEKKAIKAHVTLMILAWMVLASLAMVMSRYMKNQWKENGAICGKPIWFQVHRFTMALVLVITAAGIIIIFYHKKWKLIYPNVEDDPYSVHPVMGITVGCLLVVNMLAGLFRPHLYSPYRPLFFWSHSIVGHGTHLAAAVTMYLGVMQGAANMPPWSRWVIVGFAAWRILSDVLLTSTKLCIREPPVDYVALANNELDDNAIKVAGWRCGIVIVYLIGVVILAVTLIVAANMAP